MIKAFKIDTRKFSLLWVDKVRYIADVEFNGCRQGDTVKLLEVTNAVDTGRVMFAIVDFIDDSNGIPIRSLKVKQRINGGFDDIMSDSLDTKSIAYSQAYEYIKSVVPDLKKSNFSHHSKMVKRLIEKSNYPLHLGSVATPASSSRNWSFKFFCLVYAYINKMRMMKNKGMVSRSLAISLIDEDFFTNDVLDFLINVDKDQKKKELVKGKDFPIYFELRGYQININSFASWATRYPYDLPKFSRVREYDRDDLYKWECFIEEKYGNK